ncbi:LCP family protein [Solirubrobacter sp. CPCC 204708]|uniref:LCP family protein n=1 Tax=Solirubrobacter deserti TaxID=2282478 RepID=A0ABT4RFG2_9ACTN|nr:LCP family protein [Solirubrobacter deserti]MBE2319419.1 LCP family protein [Solirubrobacter deserti]MDA0137296.1 LCP family protein [Solirubrobacter deserti]
MSASSSTLARLLAACAIVFACCAGGVFAVGASELHATADALEAQPRIDLATATTTTRHGADTDGEARTILLIGSDHRAKTAKANARSDTMMLVRLSPRAKAVTVLSVPRDLQVTLNGRTAKVNAAYAQGGAALTVKTLHELLRVDIDHVIDVEFSGFRALVDQLDCVYTDVDRRYFNRNVGTAATNYASIDIQAGYQRLCGRDALDYVRYRHGDNDLVRAARQQEFLRQARAQAGVTQLLGDRHALLRALGKYTRTDIRGTKEVTALVKLALDGARKPVVQVRFPATIGPSYVTASPPELRAAVRRFLHPVTKSAAPKQRSSAKRKTSRVRVPTGVQTRREYTLEDEQGAKHRASHVSVRIGPGEFYGIQTTDWSEPPILAAPDGQRTVGGRTYDLYYDGKRLRRVALRTAEGTAWVSNTLTLSLSKAQMLALARRLR